MQFLDETDGGSKEEEDEDTSSASDKDGINLVTTIINQYHSEFQK